jgi:hypothetical protein
MNVRHTMVFALAVMGGWVCAAAASAEPVVSSQAKSGRQAGAKLTPDQMKAFSDLVGDSPGRISARLAIDSNLAQIAIPAANERMSRKRVGTVLTVIGFGILGVGGLVGSAIMVTTPGYPVMSKMSGHMNRFYLGLGIGLASTAVGLAMGIPGIMQMAAESEEEEQARDYYSPARPELSLKNDPAQVLGKTLAVPLMSLAF